MQLLFATALCAAIAIIVSRRSRVIFKNADFRNTAADSFWKMLLCSDLVVQDKSLILHSDVGAVILACTHPEEQLLGQPMAELVRNWED